MASAADDSAVNDLFGKPDYVEEVPLDPPRREEKAEEPEPAQELDPAETYNVDPDAEPEEPSPPAPIQEPGKPDEPEEEPEPIAADAEPEPEPEHKQKTPPEVALRRELSKLRGELNQQKAMAQQLAQAQPQPQVPQSDSPAAQIPGVPVVVSEDGNSVYVPMDEIDRRADERAAEAVRRAMTPTPDQIADRENEQMMGDFRANREGADDVLETAKDADDYLYLKVSQLSAQGFKPNGPADIVAAIRQTGIDQEFGEYFPTVAPMLDEFVGAWATKQATWKRSVLERMSGAASAPAGASGAPVVPLQDVSGVPKSPARKGGARSLSPRGEKAEFDQLADEFHKNPVGMASKRYDRMKVLGKKLNAPGLESF